jgi:hypothetical protein
MMEVIFPADGELAVIDALLDRFPGEASGQIPKPVPDRFFRVLAVGGFDRDIVTGVPTVVVESFSVDQDEASQRAMTALGYLLADGRGGSLGGVVCYGVRVISFPSNLPLESLPNHHRYSATISAALHGVVV